MKLSDITVEVRDKSLARVGLIRPEDLDISATIVLNNVGSWTLSLAYEHPMAAVLRTPGSGIIVTGPTDVLFSGPVTAPVFTASSDDPRGTLDITGVTDDIVLADMLCFPDPTNVNPTTQTLAHDVRSGPAETVMHGFVNANTGPGAVSARRKAGLIMGVNAGRGPTIKKSARFDVLGSLLADIAVSVGMRFRVVQRGSNLVFETDMVTDRSAVIRLDLWNNTLASQKLAVSAPTATQVIVAGQGDLTERQFYAATNAQATQAETDWGRRIERFIDQRQTDDTSEHVQKANEVLAAEGLTLVSAQAVPMDDTVMRFGYDFNLGDIISSSADNGEYVATVTSVVMSLNSEGVKLGTGLGDAARLTGSGAALAKLTSLSSRLDQLERI